MPSMGRRTGKVTGQLTKAESRPTEWSWGGVWRTLCPFGVKPG